MLRRIDESKRLKAEADEMHKRYLESKERIRSINLEIKRIHEAIRVIEEDERRLKEAELKRRIEEEAEEKLKRGEKLTFEEFKALLEKGRIV